MGGDRRGRGAGGDVDLQICARGEERHSAESGARATLVGVVDKHGGGASSSAQPMSVEDHNSARIVASSAQWCVLISVKTEEVARAC